MKLKGLSLVFILCLILLIGCGSTARKGQLSSSSGSAKTVSNAVYDRFSQQQELIEEEPKNISDQQESSKQSQSNTTDSTAKVKPSESKPQADPFTVSITNPKTNSNVELNPVILTWTLKNTTSNTPWYTIRLRDLTSDRISYYKDLNINANHEQAKPISGGWSWTIPIDNIPANGGYTLEKNHKYELTLKTTLSYNGSGRTPYSFIYKTVIFTIGSNAPVAVSPKTSPPPF